MTITLTKEELQEFQKKITDYELRRFEFVTGAFASVLRPEAIGEIKARKAEYERANPRPDWTSLLR